MTSTKSSAGHPRGLGASGTPWPDQFWNCQVLHTASPPESSAIGEAFDYAEEFEGLDLNTIIKDLRALINGLAGIVDPPADFCRCSGFVHPRRGVA